MERLAEQIFKDASGAHVNGKNKIEGVKLLQSIKDATIATCFLDPQYRGVLDKLKYGNEGVSRGKARSELQQMNEETIVSFIVEINRVVQPSGHLFLWVDKFHLCTGVLDWFTETDFKLVDLITWDKEKIGMGYRTRRKSEYLIIFQKEPIRAKDIWTDHAIPDVWSEKVDKTHPHSKPVDLQKRLIETTTKEGDFVLDPAASGYSVLEACGRCGRNFIGGDVAYNEEEI